MKSVALYIMCAAFAALAFCGCSGQRQIGSSKLFSRETVLAFYAVGPGEKAPGPLYERALTFAPTVVFVADATAPRGVWSAYSPGTADPKAVPLPGDADAMDAGVVHVSQIADLQQFLTDEEFRREELADAARSIMPWKIVLLPVTVLGERVYDGFDELARSLEQHGAILALSPGEGYLRSRPVGSIAQTSVRYIALPSVPQAADVEAPWLNATPQGGRYAILRAAPGRLSWSLYDAEGKLLDLVTIRPEARAVGAADFLLTAEVSALMKYGTGEDVK